MPLQGLAESRMQRQEINVFDGSGADAGTGSLAASTLGLTHVNLVGGLISGARNALLLDKGFQQVDRMPILALPIAA